MAFAPCNPVVPENRVSDLYREQLLLNPTGYESPIPPPTVSPVLTLTTASSTLPAGTYRAAYTYVNASGSTVLSGEAQIDLVAGQRLVITAPTKPSGATAVAFFMSTYPNSPNLALVVRQAGVAATVTALPADPSAVPPRSAASGPTDDYRANSAQRGGYPVRSLQGSDTTAYPTAPNDDSWTVHIRERGGTV